VALETYLFCLFYRRVDRVSLSITVPWGHQHNDVQLSVDKIIIDKINVGKKSIDKKSIGKMSVDKKFAGKMSLDKMSVARSL